jgi:zinc transport system substrate-binding protein
VPTSRVKRLPPPLSLVLCLGFLLLPVSLALGQEPVRVAVSVKPIHDLVLGVTVGVSEPALLVPGGASPHDHALRPSDMRNLQQARVVIWVGPELENFLVRPLAGLSGEVHRIALLADAGLVLHPVREGGIWDAHDHDHGHENRHGHSHAGHRKQNHGHGHDHEHGHDHGEADAHVWLSPENARRIVRHVAARLAELDPPNAAAYRANSERMVERLDRLDTDIDRRLDGVRDRPFIVFHDAYQYFERHFRLTPAGSITVDPSRPPGARRVQEIRHRVAESDALCVFSEPQFRPAIVTTVTEGTRARTGVLDPLGADLPSGPDGYEQLLRNLADSLAECLS